MKEAYRYRSTVDSGGITIFQSSNKKSILAVICNHLDTKNDQTITVKFQNPNDAQITLVPGQCILVHSENISIAEDSNRKKAVYTVAVLETDSAL